MITNRIRLLVTVAVLLFHPTLCGAQSSSTWEGFLELKGVGRLRVQYIITTNEDEQWTTMKTTDGPASPVTDILWTETHLQFTWGGFACQLERWSDRYQGDCTIKDDPDTAYVSLNVPSPDQRENSGWSDGGDVLRAEDLVATGARDMYGAIEALRPRWLLPRGPLKYLRPLFVSIYLDGQPQGDVSFLRRLEVDIIQTARYYSASDATFYFGPANEGGVIALRSHRR